MLSPVVDGDTEINLKIHCHPADVNLLAEALRFRMDMLSADSFDYRRLSHFYDVFRRVSELWS